MTVYISDVAVGTNAILIPGPQDVPRVVIPEHDIWIGDEFVVPGAVGAVQVARGRHHMVLPGEWWVVSNRNTEIDLRVPSPEGELEAFVKTVSPLSTSTPPPDTVEYIPQDRVFRVYYDGANWPSFTRPEWTLSTEFFSPLHVNAQNPLALMVEGDAWYPHPDAAVYEQLYV